MSLIRRLRPSRIPSEPQRVIERLWRQNFPLFNNHVQSLW
jgi:hypothetical protein